MDSNGDTHEPFCRSPQGERGLKCPSRLGHSDHAQGRSPQGERGLKFAFDIHQATSYVVAPRKGSVD